YGEIYPLGIFKTIRRVAAYQRPIFITENGLPDSDDDQRPGFIISHLRQIWAAMQDNVPVMGYYYWSLVDNFEWDRGWKERFGLIAVDPETQQRTVRKSGELYRQICRSGRIDREMVAEFAPGLLEEIYPK
ncbi:MAG: glycoside hydrolase family 1 protein, partial [Anaerolineales bacterium]|nr:glycoside hydrolase family 1 protein [Anaerolineales bacterium]